MNRRTVLTVAALAGAAALWLAAQQQQQNAAKTLPELLPGGALLAVEARDLNSLVSAWNASPEKKTWLASGAYQSYIRSKLALRLEEVQKDYATGLGVNPNYALLENIAGTEAALAVYDIGKLEMLYITRLAQARAADNLLTRARTQFQARTAAGRPYYTKAAGDGSVAFAIAGDLLIVGTREDLVANSLQLLRNGSGASLRQERWYTQAATAAAASNPPDVRLSVHMERTVRTPHFRSYWIQQNITALKAYSATVSDLYFGQAGWTEKRTLVRAEPQPAEASATELASLAPYLPSDAGFLQAWAKPSVNDVETLIRERFEPSASSGTALQLTAPGETSERREGREDDLDQRIDTDEPVLLRDASRTLPIVRLGATPHVVAAAKVAGSRTLADGVYATLDSAIVLLRDDANWDNAAVQTALRDSGVEPQGLAPVHAIVDGKVFILSNSKPLADRIAAKRGGAASQGLSYKAVYRHSAERGNYARIMRMIDFPKVPTTTPRPPMLFSENIAGIGDVLGAIESVTMESKEEGTVVRQSVVYQRKRT